MGNFYKWSIGVLEYWNIDEHSDRAFGGNQKFKIFGISVFHYSITPTLQYSNFQCAKG
jgi:hypothetical protein